MAANDTLAKARAEWERTQLQKTLERSPERRERFPRFSTGSPTLSVLTIRWMILRGVGVNWGSGDWEGSNSGSGDEFGMAVAIMGHAARKPPPAHMMWAGIVIGLHENRFIVLQGVCHGESLYRTCQRHLWSWAGCSGSGICPRKSTCP